jgi:chromosome segregation ATPase
MPAKKEKNADDLDEAAKTTHANIDLTNIAEQLRAREADIYEVNKDKRQNFRHLKLHTDETVLEYRESIKQAEKNNDDLRAENDKLDQRVSQLEHEIENMQKTNDQARTDMHRRKGTEVATIEQKLKDMKSDSDARRNELGKKRELEQDKKDLEAKLADERKKHGESKTKMDRERMQATEKLRKEMEVKIKETKANLSALNDEQQQTTTRLTIMQNSQLTQELEFQSKQTETLLT